MIETMWRARVTPSPFVQKQLVTSKFLATTAPDSSCRGTQSADLMDSWKAHAQNMAGRRAWRQLACGLREPGMWPPLSANEDFSTDYFGAGRRLSTRSSYQWQHMVCAVVNHSTGFL
jgi:hypothetical protein